MAWQLQVMDGTAVNFNYFSWGFFGVLKFQWPPKIMFPEQVVDVWIIHKKKKRIYLLLIDLKDFDIIVKNMI